MKIELTKKSILVIVAILLIPSGIAFAAVFNGSENPDIILGSTNKDTIKGKGGEDLILGLGNSGPPNKVEKLSGGNEDDEIIGDADPFDLCGSTLFPSCTSIGTGGADLIEGGNGDDFLVGDVGDDEIIGGQGAGDDIMFGGSGNDAMVGGNGADKMYGLFGDDILQGGNGNDILMGNWGNDDLSGGHGADTLDGGEDPNGLDIDICRVTVGEDTWVNCEIVLDEQSGEPIDPSAVCGNFVVEGTEQCDDGNLVNGDGCSSICTIEPICGNNIVEIGEQCDDGNTMNGDGCSSICQLEAPICGNFVVEGTEQCDDGNLVNGDGCSSTCTIEPVCGDGIVTSPEQCDDGNTVSGDGCSATCNLEAPPPPSGFDVQLIIDEVQDESSLSTKDRNQLLTSLNNSQAAADDGDLPTACNKIGQFDQRVNRLLNKDNVDPDVAGTDSGWLRDSNEIQVVFCDATPLPPAP